METVLISYKIGRREKNMKKIISLLLILVLLLTLVACTGDTGEEPDPNPPVDEPGNGDEVVDPEPSTGSEEVALYFADNEYVLTGDESITKLVVENREVEYGSISLEEAIVRELMKGPEDTEELATLIPATVELIDVEVTDGTAHVNFAQDGLHGGSMQESFTISQIVSSLVELDTVDRVQFLIDGQEAEALMGHIEISEPFEGSILSE